MITASNPILPGCYRDPSICRVGDEYFLVTSTFEYLPGLPVIRSRDLVHWEPSGTRSIAPGCWTSTASILPLRSTNRAGLQIASAALGLDRLLIGAAEASFARLLADPLGEERHGVTRTPSTRRGIFSGFPSRRAEGSSSFGAS